MERYRVFLSSPGDVQLERDRAESVMKKLDAEHVDHTQFELVRWEQEYYSATADFQTQIPEPADCDIVVCIFWKRLGTELPQSYVRPDGTIPTGTEYEFECALDAAGSRPEKLPDVLVYRKTAAVMFSADTVELERAQYERFMAFWQRWFHTEKGHFLAGFQSFATPDEFERVFEDNLRSWLRNREVKVTWTGKSPFRGLEPFDVEHAPIFFGRRREVERTRGRLLACVTAGRPFLLITGASGSGKSSLARAGLIPRLSQVGALSTLGAMLRYAIVTPGQIAGDWGAGFARALFEKTAIGDELARGDFQSPDELKSQLAQLDGAAVLPVQKALKRAGEEVAAKESRSDTPAVVLLVLIDQFEELFAWRKEQAEDFLRLLKSFSEAPGSPVWLVATMRSDYQHRLVEYGTLEALAGRAEVKGPGEAERTLELALPAPGDLREMILQPARAAGLSFEASENGSRDLAGLIDRQAHPEAMPAVQFLLSELYARRKDNVLTLDAFDALGGVVGVMATRGEDVYWAVDDEARAAFPRVVRALVTQTRGDAAPSARRVGETAFANDPAGASMIAALKNARLIISDRGEIRFTHDSILTGWKRLRDQIGEEQRLFETRERLEQLCTDWAKAGQERLRRRKRLERLRLLWVEAGKARMRRRKRLKRLCLRWVEAVKERMRCRKLLLEGFQLEEGRTLLAKWGKENLAATNPELPNYIAASTKRAKHRRILNHGVAWIFVATVGLLGWVWDARQESEAKAKQESDRASASLWAMKSASDLQHERHASAVGFAAKGFERLPVEMTRSALASALFGISPHLHAAFTVGAGADAVKTRAVEALVWTDPDTVLFAARKGGQFRAVSAAEPGSGSAAADWPMPRVTRPQDGNPSPIRTIRAIGTGRLIAVLDNGAIALVERGAKAAGIRAPSRRMTLYANPHAAAIGRTGTVITVAPLDEDVALIACALPAPSGGAPDCEERVLPNVRGRAVAVSPDEARIAVADEEGSVSVYDLLGRRIGDPITVGGTVLALDWASGRDWLALGTQAGEILVIDIRAPKQPVAKVRRHVSGPIMTLAWSPDGSWLAFACYRGAVCVWPASIDATGKDDVSPIRRFDGHRTNVTRLAWSPAQEQIGSAASHEDGTIRIWGVAQNTDAGLTLYADSESEFTTVATSHDGRLIAAGARDGTIHVWDAGSGDLRRTAKPSFGSAVASLAWTRSGLLAAAHDRSGITLVPADHLKPLREIKIETVEFGARIAVVEKDGMLALTQRGDNAIALIDIATTETKTILPTIDDKRSPFGIAADPAGTMLFVSYSDGDGAIKLWDLTKPKPAADEMAYALQERRDPVAGSSLAVSADGRWLATSGGDMYVRLYDIAKRTAWRALPIESNEPLCVAFSPDGRKLAALGSDNRVYVWRLRENGAERYLTFDAIPRRAKTTEASSSKRVLWLAWVTDDSIALAGGRSAMNVIGLDAEGWRRRVAAIAPVKVIAAEARSR